MAAEQMGSESFGGVCIVMDGPGSSHDAFADNGNEVMWFMEEVQNTPGGGGMGRLTLHEFARVLWYLVCVKGVPQTGDLARLLDHIRRGEMFDSADGRRRQWAFPPWNEIMTSRSPEMTTNVW